MDNCLIAESSSTFMKNNGFASYLWSARIASFDYIIRVWVKRSVQISSMTSNTLIKKHIWLIWILHLREIRIKIFQENQILIFPQKTELYDLVRTVDSSNMHVFQQSKSIAFVTIPLKCVCIHLRYVCMYCVMVLPINLQIKSLVNGLHQQLL